MEDLTDKSLSELLEIAIDDLKKCERSDDYEINMAVWYKTNGKCSVCMAGSVLAQTMGLGPSRKDFEAEFHSQKNIINAIDDLRIGNILGAYQTLHGNITKGENTAELHRIEEKINTCPYGKDKDKFFYNMEVLKEMLINNGY